MVNRTEADDIWLVGYNSDRSPGRFYKWDRKAKQGTFLFNTRPKLDGLSLAETKPVVIRARDGLEVAQLPHIARRSGAQTPPDGLVSARRPLGARCVGL